MKSLSAISSNSALTTDETLSTSSAAKPAVAADPTEVISIRTRQSIPTLDVMTPVSERDSFLESNQSLHVLIVDDNDINLKVHSPLLTHAFLLQIRFMLITPFGALY